MVVGADAEDHAAADLGEGQAAQEGHQVGALLGRQAERAAVGGVVLALRLAVGGEMADEILLAIRVPAFAPGTGWAYEKLKRKTGDWATAGVTSGSLWKRAR